MCPHNNSLGLAAPLPTYIFLLRWRGNFGCVIQRPKPENCKYLYLTFFFLYFLFQVSRFIFVELLVSELPVLVSCILSSPIFIDCE